MKRILITALAAITISAAGAQEKTTTGSFKVYGNCGMCEKRIEKAAKVHGVIKAQWNDMTQMITVTYDSVKTSLQLVHKAIAASGHDTDKEKAPDPVYKNLSRCCLYNRQNN